MNADTRTFLGLDFGEKRIGVAVGQALTGTATPLAIVSGRDGKPDWRSLDEIITRWQPDGLVVGLPLNMDGTEQPITARARRFGHQLRTRYERAVYFADERLSTREARSRLPARRRRSSDDLHDAVAAQVILEAWMASGPGVPDLA